MFNGPEEQHKQQNFLALVLFSGFYKNKLMKFIIEIIFLFTYDELWVSVQIYRGDDGEGSLSLVVELPWSVDYSSDGESHVTEFSFE
jgi:hypothetical protein